MINIRNLETELWSAADTLRQGSHLTSQQYCMPVLGLIFLRYAYTRFKYVETELLKNRPARGGRMLPVEASDFKAQSALFLPEEAQYSYLLNLPNDAEAGKAINTAMEKVEEQSEQLKGILPKTYTEFGNDLLRELLRDFNHSALESIQDDVIGRIYEYFLNKFAPVVATDDGVFFTPKSLVRMIVNIIEPTHGIVLDPACGSGGMFVSSGDFVQNIGQNPTERITFYGQEKTEYNAELCLMNMAVHGLNAIIRSGDEANTYYNDAHGLEGKCDYVMANPPFNVDKVKEESAKNAGRLPFGLPGVNKDKEVSNANYLWISYFYAYLNDKGRAGFVMASSATDSGGKDRTIRESLVGTGHVDVILSVAPNFFYTKSLPCTLWFFDKGKQAELQDRVLFIDARNYYTAVDRTLNEWTPWQMNNLNAIVWLYRGETDKYRALIDEYEHALGGGDFTAISSRLADELAKLENGKKDAANIKDRTKKKAAAAFLDEAIAQKKAQIQTVGEALWLTEKFGDGVYKDIPGLCRLASRADIKEKNWSLTPGAYVGVTETVQEDDDFAGRMREIHQELLKLEVEANGLMETISRNYQRVLG